jgi:very-short-patch-repair endonuclease
VLARLGYRVLRLPEQLVRERLEEALSRIEAALADPP